MNIKTVQDNIYIKPITKGLQKDRVLYECYLYDIFVAQIETVTVTSKISKLRTNHIVGFSTINFQGNPKSLADKEDLYNFMEVQKEYEQSRKLLDEIIGQNKIPQLGSTVFENTLADIGLKGDKHIELQTAGTSRGFYQKICNRLQQKNLISDFGLSYKGTLNIELNLRNISEN